MARLAAYLTISLRRHQAFMARELTPVFFSWDVDREHARISLALRRSTTGLRAGERLRRSSEGACPGSGLLPNCARRVSFPLVGARRGHLAGQLSSWPTIASGNARYRLRGLALRASRTYGLGGKRVERHGMGCLPEISAKHSPVMRPAKERTRCALLNDFAAARNSVEHRADVVNSGGVLPGLFTKASAASKSAARRELCASRERSERVVQNAGLKRHRA